ncbi:MAG TPA: 30S ribosomal protein S15 [bacterium]|nr:30S ribosomal protein S15 [bacterium]
MPLTQERKQEIIREYGDNEMDTGNTKTQVALLTERIKTLSDHLKQAPKDHHSRRGLMKLVGQRKRLLRYLASKDLQGYRTLIEKLAIRR